MSAVADPCQFHWLRTSAGVSESILGGRLAIAAAPTLLQEVPFCCQYNPYGWEMFNYAHGFWCFGRTYFLDG